MNFALLDPFESDIPNEITHTLLHPRTSTTTICAFNRRGNTLACGSRDGQVIFWDLDTYSISTILEGHSQPITHLSWSRSGQSILSSSLDWNCSLWNLKSEIREIIRFATPVLTGLIHPRNDNYILVITLQDTPTILERTMGSNSWSRRILNLSEENTNILSSCVTFTPDGISIFVGTNKGSLLVYNSSTLDVGGSLLKQIYFSKSGRSMITNSSDRIIRTYSIHDQIIKPELRFLDSVDRTPWLECRISADGDFIVGACGAGDAHSIHLWDKSSGILTKLLNGPLEGMTDMTYHPTSAIIATVSSYSGAVYLWKHLPTQKFSAFEPSFRELEDNFGYVEREDEFDYSEIEVEKNFDVDVDEFIDVITCDDSILSDTDNESSS